MPIQFPKNRKEIADRIKTDVQNELPEANPFLRNSFLGALCVGFAGRIFDFYLQLKNEIIEIFPDTGEGSFLERWGSYVNIIRKSATQAEGYCAVHGVAGASIPKDTELQSLNGSTYKTTATTTVSDNSISIILLERSAQVVTATTASDHLLASGIEVTVSGSDQFEYNITASVIVISETQFQYEIAGTPVTPATGTIFAQYETASFNVISEGFGEDQNLDGGSSISFSTIISGIETTGFTQYSGVVGGSDKESDADYRDRVIERYKNPVAHFNVNEISNVVKSVPGVTRDWIQPITPDIGQVTIYFVRDNDENIIPTPAEVAKVKDEVLKIKPANTDPDDVFVKAPTPKIINFVFSELTPNTTTMRKSLIDSLDEFFVDTANVGETLPSESYKSAIWQTIDEENGDRIESYQLVSPVGDIVVSSGHIAVLGSISFP